MSYTRGFHPRRKVQVKNLPPRRRGCDARAWRDRIRLAVDAGAYIDRQPDDRVLFELDELIDEHGLEIAARNWHVPLGGLVRTSSHHFRVRTWCETGQRLHTEITLRSR